MLVDLARNDVNRVCDPLSTRVDRLMVVQKFSHVQHLTSEVSGILRPDKTRFDAFRQVSSGLRMKWVWEGIPNFLPDQSFPQGLSAARRRFVQWNSSPSWRKKSAAYMQVPLAILGTTPFRMGKFEREPWTRAAGPKQMINFDTNQLQVHSFADHGDERWRCVSPSWRRHRL